jgi:hypothetical protein
MRAIPTSPVTRQWHNRTARTMVKAGASERKIRYMAQINNGTRLRDIFLPIYGPPDPYKGQYMKPANSHRMEDEP